MLPHLFYSDSCARGTFLDTKENLQLPQLSWWLPIAQRGTQGMKLKLLRYPRVPDVSLLETPCA